MKNRLVTLIGGGGFLGRYVAQELLAAGARVRIAQRDPREALFLKPLGGLGQTQFVAVDVRKPETVARAVAGVDAVVNLVGTLSGDFHGLQTVGARTVAQAAAAAGVGSLVHISAIGADPESPSAYARSKGEGEAAVRAAFPGATILRPSIVFGREDQFVNRFAGMIASMPVVPVLRGSTKFQPVYVVDVAQAVVAALGGDSARGKTLELGGPDILSMGALIRWIAGAIGRDPVIVELPDMIGGLIALGGFLPGAPITRDQWRMLQRDNVVAAGAEGLAAVGVTPTPLNAVAPGWLVRFRHNGRFGARAAA
ncbi:MAG: complex I NDUFA9 subunit family protein [Pseudomonadota bacterium]